MDIINKTTRKLLKFKKQKNGCLECISHSGNIQGYNRIYIFGHRIQVHRLIWEELNGEIPKDLCVLHKCDNPKCSRISHLFLGTRKNNSEDAVKKGRTKMIGKGKYKLSEKDVKNIFCSNKKYNFISKKYGISNRCIANIRCRWTYKYITENLKRGKIVWKWDELYGA